MGAFSISHWAIVGVVLFVVLFVLGYPASRVLKRIGFSRWWVVVALIPYVNVVGLWILAFVKWPIERR
ncbi:MAG: hypothetical protein KKG69_04535 [Alphaproteobacteria bacterium]|uniref:hypothetical protein n=1 Tax=Brevundimonas sp. TaxID=1871086 RepID=UPI001A2F60B2|nr:hypothetical protein [Brevundimonas sp.]MBJ7318549.1 hypothetical protein [Brevundimonas sp.]MBU2230523.1 hypothetical protein [Alphaproteobacteria bacterium]